MAGRSPTSSGTKRSSATAGLILGADADSQGRGWIFADARPCGLGGTLAFSVALGSARRRSPATSTRISGPSTPRHCRRRARRFHPGRLACPATLCLRRANPHLAPATRGLLTVRWRLDCLVIPSRCGRDTTRSRLKKPPPIDRHARSLRPTLDAACRRTDLGRSADIARSIEASVGSDVQHRA